MDFVGRKDELGVLENAYDSGESAFIPVYGRRRVGKSELILHFMEGRHGIYYLGKKAPPGHQMRELLDEAAVALDEPLLRRLEPKDWETVLDSVVSARRPADGDKLILALDEFQWMAGTSPELPSVLQKLWDRKWKARGDVFLILCGSYLGFMEREVLGRKSPLFGRRTAQIFLQPFGFREAAEFHPRYSRLDQARTYFLCGGVPFYLLFFRDGISVQQNILRNFLSEHSALHREPDFLLREELREVENYYAILTAIASGHARPREIAKASGLDAAKLPYYLQQLRDLGYVRRRHPLNGKPSPRRVRYVLDDPLLRFWFRFVFPHTSFLYHRGPEATYQNHIDPRIDAYFGHAFEALCREALPYLYDDEGVASSYEVGEYWSPKVQIDVVGLRDDGITDLGECKWGRLDARSTARDLRSRAQHYPNEKGATLHLRLFGRKSGADLDGVRRYGLEDLYGDA